MSEPNTPAPSAEPTNQPAPGAPATPPAGTPEPAAVPGDDLAKLLDDPKILENSALWNHPRIKELREAKAQLTKHQSEAQKQQEKALEDNKKFEELATQRGDSVAKLEGQIKDMSINQALTSQLVPAGVIDIDGALKLVDKSNITIDESGQVQGLDEALASLKTDRPYLFTGENTPPAPTPVGAGSNPGNGGGVPGAPMKFKQSQLSDPAFYKANRDAILEAQRNGLIEMGV